MLLLSINFFVFVFGFIYVFVFIDYKQKINLHLWYVSNAIMRYFFIYLHVSMGHLFVKLLAVNLTPLVYDAALFISS